MPVPLPTHLPRRVKPETVNLQAIDAWDSNRAVAVGNEGIVVVIDTSLSAELLAEGDARELTRAVQDLRKQAGLALDARIRLRLDAPCHRPCGARRQGKDRGLPGCRERGQRFLRRRLPSRASFPTIQRG